MPINLICKHISIIIIIHEDGSKGKERFLISSDQVINLYFNSKRLYKMKEKDWICIPKKLEDRWFNGDSLHTDAKTNKPTH